MTDGHVTKIVHEPFFGKLAMHNFMHDLFSEYVSLTITHSNQPTYETIHNAQNNSITWAK